MKERKNGLTKKQREYVIKLCGEKTCAALSRDLRVDKRKIYNFCIVNKLKLKSPYKIRKEKPVIIKYVHEPEPVKKEPIKRPPAVYTSRTSVYDNIYNDL